ncbi:hypothetical protein GCM10009820_13210 [Leifsonia soli]
MNPWVVIAAVVLIAALWWAVKATIWRHDIRQRISSIRRSNPAALITSAQVSASTHRALRRIARESGGRFVRTGAFYSLVATPGELRLVGGANHPYTIASFPASDIRDGRIGKTSWVYVDYTTLFVGIKTAGTTFELPIRINGTGENAMFPASQAWAGSRWEKILQLLGADS